MYNLFSCLSRGSVGWGLWPLWMFLWIRECAEDGSPRQILTFILLVNVSTTHSIPHAEQKHLGEQSNLPAGCSSVVISAWVFPAPGFTIWSSIFWGQAHCALIALCCAKASRPCKTRTWWWLSDRGPNARPVPKSSFPMTVPPGMWLAMLLSRCQSIVRNYFRLFSNFLYFTVKYMDK